MATETLNSPPLVRRRPLTGPQAMWLLFQAVLLLSLTGRQFFAQADSLSLLWTNAAGVRMAVAALVILLLNFAALVGGFFVLNLARQRGLGQTVLQAFLCVGCFLLLYLPSLFVLLVGPATVNIRNTMLRP